MNKATKILVTVGLVFLFIVIFGAISGAASDAGRTSGILGLIVFGGLIGGLRAIWKSDKKDGDQNDNTAVLQR